MSNSYFEEYSERLLAHLCDACRAATFIAKSPLSSTDIEEKWNEMAPEYFGDAVKEFNAYPEFALACAGFLGMGVARRWDVDWTLGSTLPYSSYQDGRGFDFMDEFILEEVLKVEGDERKKREDAMKLCTSCAMSYLRHETVERGTVTAYKLVLATMVVMFRMGEALELEMLGYKMEKVNFS